MTHCTRRSFRSLLRDPDMLHGPILPSLAAFSVPIFLSMLFQNLYNTVDGIIVGRFLGEAALAAVGAGGVVLNLLIGFANGVGTGMSMAIARRYGAGDAAGVKRTAAACLVIGLAITLTLTVLGLVFLEDLLRLLNTPEEIFGEAERYIRIVVANIAVCFLYNVFCGMLKALGNSVMPLVYLIISSGLNILLDLLLVVALKRSVSGAAEATVIAQAVSALCSGWYIFRRMPALVPERAHFRFDRALYVDIFKRENDNVDEIFEKEILLRNNKSNFYIITISTSNVSSSKFRETFDANYVLDEVYDLIIKNGYYK